MMDMVLSLRSGVQFVHGRARPNAHVTPTPASLRQLTRHTGDGALPFGDGQRMPHRRGAVASACRQLLGLFKAEILSNMFGEDVMDLISFHIAIAFS
jgi:hypothetical protein